MARRKQEKLGSKNRWGVVREKTRVEQGREGMGRVAERATWVGAAVL